MYVFPPAALLEAHPGLVQSVQLLSYSALQVRELRMFVTCLQMPHAWKWRAVDAACLLTPHHSGEIQ
jgi:hypothetical protein